MAAGSAAIEHIEPAFQLETGRQALTQIFLALDAPSVAIPDAVEQARLVHLHTL